MPYTVEHYNGNILGTVADGTLNANLASVTLVGRAYEGFGTAFNDDLIWLTENFAGTSAPLLPLTGQVWYDTGNAIVKVYNGVAFTSIAAAVSATAPVGPNLGGQWFDTVNQQLKAWNGVAWILIGPTWTASANVTGFTTSNVGSSFFADINAQGNVVALVSSGNVTTGNISGFGNIRAGINFPTSAAPGVTPSGIYNANQITIGSADQISITTDVHNNGVIQTANSLIINNAVYLNNTLFANAASITAVTTSSLTVGVANATILTALIANAAAVNASVINAATINGGVINATAFQNNGAAPLNHILVGNGTVYVDSANIPASSANYQLVQANANTTAPGRNILNFLTPLVVTDNPTNLSTDISLPVTGTTPGSYSYANLTVDSYGRISAASSNPIHYQTIQSNAVPQTQRNVLNFTYPLQATDNANLGVTNVTIVNSSVTAGSYTYANITVDNTGRIIAAANSSVYNQTVQAGGVPSAQQPKLNFLAGNLIVVNNVGNQSTDIGLAPTGVTPGTYVCSGITVDTYGRMLSVSSGNMVQRTYTGSKVLGTVYQNTTGGPIFVSVTGYTGEGVGNDSAIGIYVSANITTVGDFLVDANGIANGPGWGGVSAFVPNLSYYKVAQLYGGMSIQSWTEMGFE